MCSNVLLADTVMTFHSSNLVFSVSRQALKDSLFEESLLSEGLLNERLLNERLLAESDSLITQVSRPESSLQPRCHTGRSKILEKY